MNKRISFPPKPSSVSRNASHSADAWVTQGETEESPAPVTSSAPTRSLKHVTVAVPPDLYRMIKIHCIHQDTNFSALIRRLLEQYYRDVVLASRES